MSLVGIMTVISVVDDKKSANGWNVVILRESCTGLGCRQAQREGQDSEEGRNIRNIGWEY